MGFGPPGAPSKNPATADKAEKKKRGARTVTRGEMPAGNLFVDLCAIGVHANCITADDSAGKSVGSKNQRRGAICEGTAMQLHYTHDDDPDP